MVHSISINLFTRSLEIVRFLFITAIIVSGPNVLRHNSWSQYGVLHIQQMYIMFLFLSRVL